MCGFFLHILPSILSFYLNLVLGILSPKYVAIHTRFFTSCCCVHRLSWPAVAVFVSLFLVLRSANVFHVSMGLNTHTVQEILVHRAIFFDSWLQCRLCNLSPSAKFSISFGFPIAFCGHILAVIDILCLPLYLNLNFWESETIPPFCLTHSRFLVNIEWMDLVENEMLVYI